MSRDCKVCIGSKTIPRVHTLHNPNEPRFVEVVSQTCRRDRQSGTLEITTVKLAFDAKRRVGLKQQVADALSRMTATGENEASIEDKLPIAVFETKAENKPSF